MLMWVWGPHTSSPSPHRAMSSTADGFTLYLKLCAANGHPGTATNASCLVWNQTGLRWAREYVPSIAMRMVDTPPSTPSKMATHLDWKVICEGAREGALEKDVGVWPGRVGLRAI